MAAKNRSYPELEGWKNYNKEIFIGERGEAVYEKLVHSQFQIPKAGFVSGLVLTAETLFWNGIMGGMALFSKLRPAHPFGVGAEGTVRILDSKLPVTDFFKPGNVYKLKIRYSNSNQDDDRAYDARAMAVSFRDENDDSLLDLIAASGSKFFPFFNLRSFFHFALAQIGSFKIYLLSFPIHLAGIIDVLRKDPPSYSLIYYQPFLTYKLFTIKDGQFLVRFKIIPAGRDLEYGRLNREEQFKVWELINAPVVGDPRPKTYLRDELTDRLLKTPIEHILQIQLMPYEEDVPERVFNMGEPWNPFHFPWVDIAVITLTNPITDSQAEALRFNVGNLPDCLEFLPSKSSHDFNSLAHARQSIYKTSSYLRSIFRR